MTEQRVRDAILNINFKLIIDLKVMLNMIGYYLPYKNMVHGI